MTVCVLILPLASLRTSELLILFDVGIIENAGTAILYLHVSVNFAPFTPACITLHLQKLFSQPVQGNLVWILLFLGSGATAVLWLLESWG